MTMGRRHPRAAEAGASRGNGPAMSQRPEDNPLSSSPQAMTSRQIKRRYMLKTRVPRVSRAEARRLERIEHQRIQREYGEEVAQEQRVADARRRQARQRAAAARRDAKRAADRASRVAQGLPPIQPKEGQQTISSFLIKGQAAGAHETHDTGDREVGARQDPLVVSCSQATLISDVGAPVPMVERDKDGDVTPGSDVAVDNVFMHMSSFKALSSDSGHHAPIVPQSSPPFPGDPTPLRVIPPSILPNFNANRPSPTDPFSSPVRLQHSAVDPDSKSESDHDQDDLPTLQDLWDDACAAKAMSRQQPDPLSHSTRTNTASSSSSSMMIPSPYVDLIGSSSLPPTQELLDARGHDDAPSQRLPPSHGGVTPLGDGTAPTASSPFPSGASALWAEISALEGTGDRAGYEQGHGWVPTSAQGL